MTTAREYLVSKGLAKAGRGKFSNDAKAELQRALSSGMSFTDYSTTGRVVPTSTPRVKAVASVESDVKKKNEESTYIPPSDFRFPEAEYKAYRLDDGKRVAVGMREVCSTCGYSLVNHGCNTPVVYGDVTVYIDKS